MPTTNLTNVEKYVMHLIKATVRCSDFLEGFQNYDHCASNNFAKKNKSFLPCARWCACAGNTSIDTTVLIKLIFYYLFSSIHHYNWGIRFLHSIQRFLALLSSPNLLRTKLNQTFHSSSVSVDILTFLKNVRPISPK